MPVKIKGYVADGYEPVQELLRTRIVEGIEEKAQLCVYVENIKVIDIFGTADHDDSYDEDRLHIVFSSSKSVTALVFACLVDQGLIEYNDKVVKHWPQFSKHNKHEITIADVLRHEAGLASLDHTFKSSDDFLTENIKKNVIGEIVENEEPCFPTEVTGYPRAYHGLSRGFILNEIFRRVEPKGRTIGEYLRDEISIPLKIDVFFGANDEEIKRKQSLTAMSLTSIVTQSLLPKSLGGKVTISALDFFNLMRAVKTSSKYQKKTPKKFVEGFPQSISTMVDIFNQDDFIKGEVPSANAFASARGLARLGVSMTNEGEIDGVRIMSKETVAKMHDNFLLKKDALFGMFTEFSQGGVNLFSCAGKSELNQNTVLKSLDLHREGFVGWQGYGGSAFQWNPMLKISFAFVPTKMNWYDASNETAALLQGKVMECAKLLKSKSKL